METSAIENLVSDTSLHQWEPEFFLNFAKPKDAICPVENNITNFMQLYGLKVPPCNYVTIADPNQTLLSQFSKSMVCCLGSEPFIHNSQVHPEVH